MTPLTGVWAASLTPLKEDLSADKDRLVSHVRWLLEKGCHGVVLLGTTGEGNSFSVQERLEIMDLAAESGLPLEQIMVGTGSCALPDTIALSRHAVRLGFRAVLMLPPFYYKRVHDDGIYDFVHRVINGVNENDLNIVLYHFPAMAGIGFSPELISRMLAFYPDHIVGIKDSGGDEHYLAALCREFPGFGVFAGTERLMAQGLEAGGAGCISATANITSVLVRAVYEDILENRHGLADDAAKSGVLERLNQMLSFRAALEAGPLVRVLKYLMASRSNAPSWNTLRPPLTAYGPSEVEALETSLSALPVFPNFVS